MRRGGLALVAILVLGSLTKILVPESPSTPPGEESRSAGIANKSLPQEEATDLDKAQNSTDWYPSQFRERIRDFFAVERGPELDSFEGKVKLRLDPALKTAGNLEQVCESPENWCVPHDQGPGIQFVIAIAPDPVHTHLGLFFDRTIDAIQQGATNQEYLFDRAIMPWQYFTQRTSEETDEQKLIRKIRESYPGLMIFRASTGTQALFVFVVGETPTAGINQEQFQNAIAMIHEIRNGTDSVSSDAMVDFRVLGPTFSGSLASLQKGLARYFGHYWKPSRNVPPVPVYAVVMGTDAIKAFGDAELPHVRMAIFMEDGKTALSALISYAAGLGYHDSYIAVLNEDDTAYGGGSYSIQSSDYLTLNFPRGISQFRSAYSKDPQNQKESADSNQPQRRNLRLDPEVTGSDDDNVAPYAPSQTALSQEAIMLSIVSELRRHDSKFILIRASDPLDELFLARYLGSQDPNARLVVPTPDLLFAREEGGVLDGALGLNTYPVSPAPLNPLCTPSPLSLQTFPAASSAGLYNATVALLAGLSSPVDTAPSPTGKVESLFDPKSACALSPNLWLTVVSRNLVNPIQVLPASPSLFFPPSGKDGEAEHNRRSGRIQTPWALFCVLCLVLLVNHAWRLQERDPLGYWGMTETPKSSQRFWKGRDWILWLGAVALAGMLVVFISSVTILPPHPEQSHGTLLVTVVLWLVWLAFTGFVTFDFCKIRNKPVFAVTFILLSICFASLGVLFAWWKSNEMVLWQQRTLNLASQVSPATPWLLLLAAFYTWFWFSLKAESLVDWRSPRLPDSTGLPNVYRRMTDSEAEEIRKVLPSFAPPWPVPVGALVVAGVIAIRWVMLGPYGIPIRSLEGISYDAMYSVGFGFGLFVLIATLLRTVVIWTKLQPLLSTLDRPGMKQALDRLKGFEWYKIWSPLESMQDEARRLYAKEIHVVERLAKSLSLTRDSGSSDNLESLTTPCQEILGYWEKICTLALVDIPAREKKPSDLVKPLTDLEEKLAQTAKLLWKDFLDPAWKALPADDGSDKPSVNIMDSPGTITVKGVLSESNDSPGTKLINAEFKGDKKDQAASAGQPRLSSQSLLLGEELVACVYATFITVVLLRIRGLVFSAVAIYTALVFSSISYPFQPAAGLRTLALFLFLLGGAAIGYVYEEMHRDPTLRNMTSTDPSKIDGAFWLKVASAGLLPLLGLLTSLFPQVGHLLYTIVAPILQATR